MDRRRLTLLAGLPLLAAVGCFGDPTTSTLVPTNPFGSTPVVPQTLAAHAPATQEAAMRVITVEKKLKQGNQQLGLCPGFLTIGSPTPEVFHVGTSQIVITEGLVKLCESEGQLAGVLGLELGKMMSEREAQAGLQTRNPNREPPATSGVGVEGGGSRGAADMTQLAEQAPYEQARKRQMHPPPPPDPKVLAKLILQRAGYGDSDLSAAEPLLKTAAENSALEKQMTTGHETRPWIK